MGPIATENQFPCQTLVACLPGSMGDPTIEPSCVRLVPDLDGPKQSILKHAAGRSDVEVREDPFRCSSWDRKGEAVGSSWSTPTHGGADTQGASPNVPWQ